MVAGIHAKADGETKPQSLMDAGVDVILIGSNILGSLVAVANTGKWALTYDYQNRAEVNDLLKFYIRVIRFLNQNVQCNWMLLFVFYPINIKYWVEF